LVPLEPDETNVPAHSQTDASGRARVGFKDTGGYVLIVWLHGFMASHHVIPMRAGCGASVTVTLALYRMTSQR
jgi:hypothetical protein